MDYIIIRSFDFGCEALRAAFAGLLPCGIVSEPSMKLTLQSLAADCPRHNYLYVRGSSNSPHFQYRLLDKAAISNIVLCYRRLLYR